MIWSPCRTEVSRYIRPIWFNTSSRFYGDSVKVMILVVNCIGRQPEHNTLVFAFSKFGCWSSAYNFSLQCLHLTTSFMYSEREVMGLRWTLRNTTYNCFLRGELTINEYCLVPVSQIIFKPVIVVRSYTVVINFQSDRPC